MLYTSKYILWRTDERMKTATKCEVQILELSRQYRKKAHLVRLTDNQEKHTEIAINSAQEKNAASRRNKMLQFVSGFITSYHKDESFGRA